MKRPWFLPSILTVLALSTSACLTPLDSGADTCFDFVEVVEREPGRVQYSVPVVDFDTQLTAPVAVPGAVLTVCINAPCIPEFPRCEGDVGASWREFPGPNPAIRVLDFPFGLTNVTIRLSAEGYIPTDYPLMGPVIGHPNGALDTRGVGIVLVKNETYVALHAQVGTIPDPARGTLALRVLGCDLTRAPAVDVEPWQGNLAGSTGFSLSTGNLASGGALRTDARGVVGLFNLPAQTVDAWVPEWGFAPATYNVRPGTLTLAEYRWGIDEFGQ
jgi:hypothetical protein